MAYIANQSYSGQLNPNESFIGKPYQIPNNYLSLQVSIKLTHTGTLSIYTSNDGSSFVMTDQKNITGNFKYYQFNLEGLYFYVKYQNGNTQDNVEIASRILQVLANQNVQVENQPPFVFDNSGNLKTSIQNAKIDVSGSFTVDGGSVGVSNFPEFYNSSYDVSNNLLLTAINNKTIDTSNISGSVTVSNPVTSVSVSNQLEDYATNTTLNNVYNTCQDLTSYSNTTAIATATMNDKIINCDTSNVTIANPVTSVNVSGSVDATITNQISDYATNTTLDALNNKVVICDTSNITIGNSVTVSGSVSVSNLYTETQTVNGAIEITNFPSSQAVTGTFWPSIQPISGTVALSNQISGFSTETTLTATNTKLDSVIADLDKLTFASTKLLCDVSGETINIGTMPSVSVSNSFNLESTQQQIKTDLDKLTFASTKLLCDVSGETVNIGTMPSVNVNLHDNSGNALNSTSNALNSYITNSSLPVSISSTLTTKIQDSSGNPIYANSGNLNVNGQVSSNTLDYLGNGITSTVVSSQRALNVNDISANVVLNKLSFDASNNLLCMPNTGKIAQWSSVAAQKDTSLGSNSFGAILDLSGVNIPSSAQVTICAAGSLNGNILILGSNVVSGATSDYYSLTQNSYIGPFTTATKYQGPPTRYLRLYNMHTLAQDCYLKVFYNY